MAILLTTGLLSSNVFAGNPDFTGKWTLDEGQSEIGEGRFRPSATLEVKQDKVSLTVVRVRTGRNGEERKMESVYSLDGKETKTGDENRTSVSTAKWSEDGKSLVINTKRSWTREGETFEFKSVETWMLGKDGKVLTIQSKSSGSRGETNIKLVYTLVS